MSEQPPPDRRGPDPDDPPPLGSWRSMYFVVLAADVLMIGLFTLFTFYFK